MTHSTKNIRRRNLRRARLRKKAEKARQAEQHREEVARMATRMTTAAWLDQVRGMR